MIYRSIDLDEGRCSYMYVILLRWLVVIVVCLFLLLSDALWTWPNVHFAQPVVSCRHHGAELACDGSFCWVIYLWVGAHQEIPITIRKFRGFWVPKGSQRWRKHRIIRRCKSFAGANGLAGASEATLSQTWLSQLGHSQMVQGSWLSASSVSAWKLADSNKWWQQIIFLWTMAFLRFYMLPFWLLRL